jgi:plasmid maintenance system antidote protein VapI
VASEIDERLLELAKREMAARRWTQRELGEKLGIQESEVSLLMNRKRRWTLKLIQAFGKATGLVIQL